MFKVTISSRFIDIVNISWQHCKDTFETQNLYLKNTNSDKHHSFDSFDILTSIPSNSIIIYNIYIIYINIFLKIYCNSNDFYLY